MEGSNLAVWVTTTFPRSGMRARSVISFIRTCNRFHDGSSPFCGRRPLHPSRPVRARFALASRSIPSASSATSIPKIYGNFIEHLGRCIDGGVFDEKSPLSDSNGFRTRRARCRQRS